MFGLETMDWSVFEYTHSYAKHCSSCLVLKDVDNLPAACIVSGDNKDREIANELITAFNRLLDPNFKPFDMNNGKECFPAGHY